MKPIDFSFIPDIPSTGILSKYRQNVNFDWKVLRVYLEGEDALRAKYMIWNRLETEPLFKRSSVTASVDQQKRTAALRMKRVLEIGFLPDEIKNTSYEKRVRKNISIKV